MRALAILFTLLTFVPVWGQTTDEYRKEATALVGEMRGVLSAVRKGLEPDSVDKQAKGFVAHERAFLQKYKTYTVNGKAPSSYGLMGLTGISVTSAPVSATLARLDPARKSKAAQELAAAEASVDQLAKTIQKGE